MKSSEPTVIKNEPSTGSKKRYRNEFTQAFQELDSGLSGGASKIAKAIQEGLYNYSENRDKSAREKRDGALRDLLKNQSKALRKALPIAAEARSEILDAISDMRIVLRALRRW